MRVEWFDDLGNGVVNLVITIFEFMMAYDRLVTMPYKWIFKFQVPKTLLGNILYIAGGLLYSAIVYILTVAILIAIIMTIKEWIGGVKKWINKIRSK